LLRGKGNKEKGEGTKKNRGKECIFERRYRPEGKIRKIKTV
jgi:hypothetical protein